MPAVDFESFAKLTTIDFPVSLDFLPDEYHSISSSILKLRWHYANALIEELNLAFKICYGTYCDVVSQQHDSDIDFLADLMVFAESNKASYKIGNKIYQALNAQASQPYLAADDKIYADPVLIDALKNYFAGRISQSDFDLLYEALYIVRQRYFLGKSGFFNQEIINLRRTLLETNEANLPRFIIQSEALEAVLDEDELEAFNQYFSEQLLSADEMRLNYLNELVCLDSVESQILMRNYANWIKSQDKGSIVAILRVPEELEINDSCENDRVLQHCQNHFLQANEIASLLHLGQSHRIIAFFRHHEDLINMRGYAAPGGLSPLMQSLWQNNIPVALWLIQHHADINQVCAFQRTVLHYAVTPTLPPRVLDAILQRTDARINEQDIAGSTALHTAAAMGNVVAVQKLLDSGADASILNHQGYSAYHIAAGQGQEAVVAVLLNHPVSSQLAKMRGIWSYDLVTLWDQEREKVEALEANQREYLNTCREKASLLTKLIRIAKNTTKEQKLRAEKTKLAREIAYAEDCHRSISDKMKPFLMLKRLRQQSGLPDDWVRRLLLTKDFLPSENTIKQYLHKYMQQQFHRFANQWVTLNIAMPARNAVEDFILRSGDAMLFYQSLRLGKKITAGQILRKPHYSKKLPAPTNIPSRAVETQDIYALVDLLKFRDLKVTDIYDDCRGALENCRYFSVLSFFSMHELTTSQSQHLLSILVNRVSEVNDDNDQADYCHLVNIVLDKLVTHKEPMVKMKVSLSMQGVCQFLNIKSESLSINQLEWLLMNTQGNINLSKLKREPQQSLFSAVRIIKQTALKLTRHDFLKLAKQQLGCQLPGDFYRAVRKYHNTFAACLFYTIKLCESLNLHINTGLNSRWEVLQFDLGETNKVIFRLRLSTEQLLEVVASAFDHVESLDKTELDLHKSEFLDQLKIFMREYLRSGGLFFKRSQSRQRKALQQSVSVIVNDNEIQLVFKNMQCFTERCHKFLNSIVESQFQYDCKPAENERARLREKAIEELRKILEAQQRAKRAGSIESLSDSEEVGSVFSSPDLNNTDSDQECEDLSVMCEKMIEDLLSEKEEVTDPFYPRSTSARTAATPLSSLQPPQSVYSPASYSPSMGSPWSSSLPVGIGFYSVPPIHSNQVNTQEDKGFNLSAKAFTPAKH